MGGGSNGHFADKQSEFRFPSIFFFFLLFRSDAIRANKMSELMWSEEIWKKKTNQNNRNSNESFRLKVRF